MYQPTIFFPVEIVDRIEAVLNPIEKAFLTLANQTIVNITSQQSIAHNLQKISEFKQKQQTLLQDYQASLSQEKTPSANRFGSKNRS